MKVAVRTIRIPVKVIKTGYVVCINNFIGEVILVTDTEVKVKYPDESEEMIPIDIAKESVAKFLAQTPDLRTYPIVHEDFYRLMWFCNTREKCVSFLKNTSTAEGSFKNIPCMPKNDDVIEVTNVAITDAYKMTTKASRIGIINQSVSKYKYNVTFNAKVIQLSRNDFKIISSDDSKQVFTLKD